MRGWASFVNSFSSGVADIPRIISSHVSELIARVGEQGIFEIERNSGSEEKKAK